MKKRNSDFTGVIIFIVMVISVVLIVSIDKWLFETIYYSDAEIKEK